MFSTSLLVLLLKQKIQTFQKLKHIGGTGVESVKMNRKKSRQLTLPDLVVLSLLSEKPMHGYQLVTELEIRDVKDWAAVSRPQVYYSLKKLLEMKIISETQSSELTLGPEKTTYKINAKGEASLARELSTDDWALHRSQPPFLTWMALSTHLPKTTIKKMFQARRKFLCEELEREANTLESFKNASGAMVVAGKMMVTITIQWFEVELTWLDLAQKQMLE